jgi:heme-degrading monooxygenase HmoA
VAIKRVWHGWTTPENADAYLEILTTVVIPGIEAKGIRGYRNIEILRRNHADEVEFVTVMAFESLQSVINFQGDDYERAYVPDVAQAVLKRWDLRSAHYDVLEERPEPNARG